MYWDSKLVMGHEVLPKTFIIKVGVRRDRGSNLVMGACL